MKKTLIISSMMFGCLALAAGLVFAANGGNQQASITLLNAAEKLCYHNNTDWSMTKTADASGLVNGSGPIVWTVTATRGTTSNSLIQVNGFLTVKNTGTAPATIGNVVINLQKPNSPKKGSNASYVSVAADIADATNGDAATTANIVAAGSQENPTTNSLWGTNNYTVSGAQGTFKETPGGSGSLEFTDADNNTIWAISPQQTIAPNASVNLLYTAMFDNSVLNIPVGASLRVEALVSFGNAGGRGGSGASAQDIDVNGNGTISADEHNVRTVPSRVTDSLPALAMCNDNVTLTDTESDISTTGTGFTVGNFVTDIGGGTGTEVITTSLTRTVSEDVTCTDGSGTVGNTANLTGASDSVALQIGIDGNGNPIYVYFPCCVGVDLDASAVVDISCNGGSGCKFCSAPLCTYTQGAYGQTNPHTGLPDGAPALLLWNNFATVYPSGVEVGIAGVGGYSMQFSTAAAIAAYLPAGGPADSLNADLVNPTSSNSGVFGGQVLALKINVDFSAAGLTQNGPLGALVLCNFGVTVDQVLADANTVLGGGTLPSYVTSISDLNDLVDNLNKAFDNCMDTDWAEANLCRP
jgi:hypothetical protein